MDKALETVRTRIKQINVPTRLLLVDDDELELTLMADRLRAAGFEIAIAHNGEEALQALDREWYPLIMADWQMPVMNGIELVEKLRERGGEDTYFIMLSVRAASEDFERGYSAGVDDYLSKKWPDAEVLARIEAGLNTVSLRRSLRKSRAALAASQLNQDATRVDAKAQLIDKLQSEIARARRYKRSCSVMVLGVHTDNPDESYPVEEDLRSELLDALRGAIRLDVDTVVWYQSEQGQLQFGIVLPETGPAEVASIRQRVRLSMTQKLREHVGASDKLTVSNGAASVDPSSDRAGLRAEELLMSAELCRRCMASCGARRLPAVQSSVVHQVAIPCRHGYAVADHCLELNHRYADERRRSEVAPKSAAG